MIQRKQTLWLFLAALLNAGVFYFDFYRYHTLVDGVDKLNSLRVGDHYPSLLIALVMTLLPLVTIFIYTNRKRQMRMTFVSILSIFSFVSMMLSRINMLNKTAIATTPPNAYYWIGAVLPAVALVFIILALLGIRKDEQLVKSVDRLR